MKTFLFIFLLLPTLLIAQVDTWNLNWNLDVQGDLTYNFIHCVGSADSISQTIGGLQYIYYKVNTGGAMNWREADGLTCAGDSITIITPGDYKILVYMAISTANVNDVLRVKLYVNSLPTSLGRWVINSQGSGVSSNQSYMWYKEFSAGDKLSVWVSNLTGAREITVYDFKLYMEKMPEK